MIELYYWELYYLEIHEFQWIQGVKKKIYIEEKAIICWVNCDTNLQNIHRGINPNLNI